MIHLPFSQRDNTPAREGHRKIAQRGYREAGEALVCNGNDVVRAEHEIGKTDNGDDGGFLDDRHELVAERGEDILFMQKQGE